MRVRFVQRHMSNHHPRSFVNGAALNIKMSVTLSTTSLPLPQKSVSLRRAPIRLRAKHAKTADTRQWNARLSEEPRHILETAVRRKEAIGVVRDDVREFVARSLVPSLDAKLHIPQHGYSQRTI